MFFQVTLIYMRVLVQRVIKASVKVEEKTVGEITKGLLLLVGITHTDTEKDVNWLAKKVLNLRVFEDSEGKMNQSLLDVNGSILCVSQFTLYGDARKGNRPGFSEAAHPEQAQKLYNLFVDSLKQTGKVLVETGKFAAYMQVELINDGPVTLMLESPIAE